MPVATISNTDSNTAVVEAYSDEKPIVLVVDDEISILNALKRSLGKIGVEVVTASTAADALYILENTEVSLIISDMRMPGMDGADLMSKVAQESPDTIRFLLSGHSDMESTIRAINEGHIHQYLTKPWNDVELRALVETTLHTHLLEFNNRQLKQELMLKNRQIDELKHLLKQKEGES
jgi:adenylate cyclase